MLMWRGETERGERERDRERRREIGVEGVAI